MQQPAKFFKYLKPSTGKERKQSTRRWNIFYVGVTLALVGMAVPFRAGMPQAHMADAGSQALGSGTTIADGTPDHPNILSDKTKQTGAATAAVSAGKGGTPPPVGAGAGVAAQPVKQPPATGSKLVQVTEPETGIAIAPTIVTELRSKEQLEELSGPAKPATVILHVSSGLRITDPSGKTELGTLEAVLDGLGRRMIPAFYVRDGETADSVAGLLKKSGIEDAFVVSDRGELVKRARTLYPALRGIVDFSSAGNLSADDLLNIRRKTTASLAKIAILPGSSASRSSVAYLQQRLIVVWTKEAGTKAGPELGLHTLITAGVNGIVTDSPKAAFKALKVYSHGNTLIRKPYIIGHRGMPSKAPENTIVSNRLGLEAGADFIENDMYLTKDGRLVILHDPLLESTTNGKGKVEDFTLAQLKKLNANKPHPAGFPYVQIPTLEEQIDLARSQGKMIMAEMKSKNPAAMDAFVKVVKDKGAEDLINTMAFNPDQLKRLSELMPEMPMGLLTGETANEANIDGSLTNTLRLMQLRNTTFNTTYKGLGPNFMEAAKHRGVLISPWTFNDKSNFAKFFCYGAFGITTDYAFWASDWAASVKPVQDHIVVGNYESKDLSVLMETFKGDRLEKAADVILLDGEISVEAYGSRITAKRPGKAHALLRYTAVIDGGSKYDLYTQPITLEVRDVKEPG
ncbi:glycerophosphodiester phosphodiesterase family protein [Paenibacillus chitinolyticus]|uniref:glycerophosphodiester phosphodiesterase family protein n=1 Tax=Paenibacillus chitinolyticus TaxID=79263 RepID=UPI00366B4882